MNEYINKVYEEYQKAMIKMAQDMVVYGTGTVSIDEEGIVKHIPFWELRNIIMSNTTLNSKCYNTKCSNPSTPGSFFCHPDCHENYINEMYGPSVVTGTCIVNEDFITSQGPGGIIYDNPTHYEIPPLKECKVKYIGSKAEPKCTCMVLSWGAHENTCPWIIWKQDNDKS